MTVREIFDLRKQGHIEEAYEAIRPLYAAHHGHYTTLCMFWTAADVFKLRLQQDRTDEAAKIYKALQRLVPNIDDREGTCHAFMSYAAERLKSLNSPTPEAGTSYSDSDITFVTSDSTIAQPTRKHPTRSNRPQERTSPLTIPQRKVLSYITDHQGCNVPAIASGTGIPAKSVERHVKALAAARLILHRGSNKTGGYYPIE